MLQANLAFMWPDGMMHKTIEDKDGVIDMPPISDYYQTLDLQERLNRFGTTARPSLECDIADARLSRTSRRSAL